MPIGVICDALSVIIGGWIGAKAGNRLSQGFKDNLNLVFGMCAMGIGVSSIPLMENMPAVILALILGTIIGLAIHLNEHIEHAGAGLEKLLSRTLHLRGASSADDNRTALLVTAIVLFCSSGTGIYGAIVAGMSGDHSILIAKSILDLFTALIFACSLGAVVSAIALPQFIIFAALFACARLIFPLTTPSMINDFKACGGFIMLATGLRIAKVKQFPIADMIPALILVWPLSSLWATVVMPLLG